MQSQLLPFDREEDFDLGIGSGERSWLESKETRYHEVEFMTLSMVFRFNFGREVSRSKSHNSKAGAGARARASIAKIVRERERLQSAKINNILNLYMYI